MRDRLIDILYDVENARIDTIADHLLAEGVIVPQFKAGDHIWVIDIEDGEAVDVSCVQYMANCKNCVIATAFINDYDFDETLDYHISETQERFDAELKVYPEEDCFPTREEAEKALAEKRGQGMKPVVYQKERMIDVLHKGECGGHKFCILNLGTHPTAYVECKLEDCHDYCDGRFGDIPVNGGFTYFGKAYWDETDKTKYLGWDYAHCDDFAGYYEEGTYLAENTKKWTTEEIYAEVLNAISHLVDIERSNENAE